MNKSEWRKVALDGIQSYFEYKKKTSVEPRKLSQ